MITITDFKRAYSKAVKDNYAAIFAGAGLSMSSGFVDWKGLLQMYDGTCGVLYVNL